LTKVAVDILAKKLRKSQRTQNRTTGRIFEKKKVEETAKEKIHLNIV
jgi:uncharacterized protein YoaH (UPF0181 family)